MNMQKIKEQNDERVTAPLIRWKTAIVIFIIIFLVTMVQTLILAAFMNQLPVLISVLVNYLLCACIMFFVIFMIFWRYKISKPIKKLAKAARSVAKGDFSVRIESDKKKGKKGEKRNEIDVLIDDFNIMTRELAGNEMLKSDFIANVSHEIKTPLSIIGSYTKALRDDKVPQEMREQYMDVVINATQNLNDMITNVLKLNKLENQQIFENPETYQLGEQLRSCALSFMDRWQEKNIDFEIDVADVAVSCSANLLELVWNNLLSNAIKFTPEGGKISLTSKVIGDTVSVSFKDSGCGIEESEQERIFEKFYQADTSHAVQGNGLGLALVKRVTDIVGGRITVKSEPKKGSEFIVALKVAEQNQLSL